MRAKKWYGRLAHTEGVRVQRERRLMKEDGIPFTLPEPIVRAAAAEYYRQGNDQSYERLQERGGLGILEIVALLADALGVEVP